MPSRRVRVTFITISGAYSTKTTNVLSLFCKLKSKNRMSKHETKPKFKFENVRKMRLLVKNLLF